MLSSEEVDAVSWGLSWTWDLVLLLNSWPGSADAKTGAYLGVIKSTSSGLKQQGLLGREALISPECQKFICSPAPSTVRKPGKYNKHVKVIMYL